MGGMKLPIGMTRRAFSYDDNLEAPMSTPPHDISINTLWRRPVIPERKFSQLAEVRRGICNRRGGAGGDDDADDDDDDEVDDDCVLFPPGG